MYLRTLRYQGLKRLADTMREPLSFVDEQTGTARSWTVLLGENGTCKTTLLQAIALAAVGVDTSNQLAVSVRTRLQDVRRKKATVIIEAEFEFDPDFHEWRRYPGLVDLELSAPPRIRSRVELAPRKRTWSGGSWYLPSPGMDERLVAALDEVENPLEQARSEEHLPFWFVAGYGVDRHLHEPGKAPAVEDAVLNRLEPLFPGSERMVTGTGFAEDKRFDPKVFAGMLKAALMHNGALVPDVTNLELRGKPAEEYGKRLVEGPKFAVKMGQKSYKMPATWLSQGYQSVIAWVADLMGHALLESEGRRFDPMTLSGLVLVDEVDQYLHPKWQVQLIPALRETFPHIQFVATTHSPMVLPGLREEEINRLRFGEDGRVVVEPAEHDPRLKTGAELYRDFFGVDGLQPTALARDARDYRRLASNPFRTDADQARLEALARSLHDEDVPIMPAVARRERDR